MLLCPADLFASHVCNYRRLDFELSVIFFPVCTKWHKTTNFWLIKLADNAFQKSALPYNTVEVSTKMCARPSTFIQWMIYILSISFYKKMIIYYIDTVSSISVPKGTSVQCTADAK